MVWNGEPGVGCDFCSFFLSFMDFLWIRRRWDCFGVVDSQKDMDVSKSGSSNRYRIKTCIYSHMEFL